jgi:predicted ferric reductase
MNRQTDITRSLPPAVQKVSSNLQRWGFWSFWLQLVLGIIASVTLLFATPVLFDSKEKAASNQFGIFSAFVGIVLLIIAIIISYRYGKIGRKIQNLDPSQRPKKSDTIQLIKIGLIFNMVGMLFAILGAFTLVGLTLAKLLTLAPQLIGPNTQQYVNSLDMLIIQANTNTIAAHFTGIVTSLLLLNRITS